MRWNVRLTIPILDTTKTTPPEPKKAKRSIAPSKRSHLEAIRVDWQRVIDQSSIADFKPSQASIAELTQSGSSELPQNSLEDHSSMKLLILLGESTSWPFSFLWHVERPRPITDCARVHTEWKQYGWHERCNGSERGRTEWEHHLFFDCYCM